MLVYKYSTPESPEERMLLNDFLNTELLPHSLTRLLPAVSVAAMAWQREWRSRTRIKGKASSRNTEVAWRRAAAWQTLHDELLGLYPQ